MKYIHVYALSIMIALCTSCVQKQTALHKDFIDYTIKDTVTSFGPNTMVRNVRQSRNGTILIAASFSGVFRYNGKSFTNLTSQIAARYDGKTIASTDEELRSNLP